MDLGLLGRVRGEAAELFDDSVVAGGGVPGGQFAGGLLTVPQALHGEAGGEAGVGGGEGGGGAAAQVGGGRFAVDVPQDGGGTDDTEAAGTVDQLPQAGRVRALLADRAAQRGQHQLGVAPVAATGEHRGGGRAQPVPARRPDPGPFDGCGAGHPLVGGQRGRDQLLGGEGAGGRGLDQVEDVGIVALGEVVEDRGPRRVRGAAPGAQQLGAVVRAGHGGQAAGGGDVAVLGRFEVQALLGPPQDLGDTPAGARAARAQLSLPAVEGPLFPGGGETWAVARVLGPQPPGAGLEGVPDGGGQLGLALLGPGEAGEDRGGEGHQPRVVVPQRQFVQGPAPVAAGRGVAAQQQAGGVPAVRGEVAEDGECEAGALLAGVHQVVGVEQMPFDLLEPAVELHVEARVVERAVLDLPVAPGVAQHAVVERRERLRPRRREGVQGPVAAASLQEAEQGATGRYVWIEHEVSIRCGEQAGNGISADRHSCR
ncbi:hypothetical protein SSP35_04_04980 [Streptomyces sp. NBRC 110611]|nr:hypothetical protein SSP35_04_04980 [Streptomyces sp. NBRC 110611]